MYAVLTVLIHYVKTKCWIDIGFWDTASRGRHLYRSTGTDLAVLQAILLNYNISQFPRLEYKAFTHRHSAYGPIDGIASFESKCLRGLKGIYILDGDQQGLVAMWNRIRPPS